MFSGSGYLNYKDPAAPRLVKIVALAPTDYDFKSALYAIKATEGLISHTKRSVSTDAICDFAKFTGQPLVPADDRGIGLEFNDAPLAWEPLTEASGCPHVLDALPNRWSALRTASVASGCPSDVVLP